jgi:threonylcarbamoyladenosine tRNA methylthiotransferase MtaB
MSNVECPISNIEVKRKKEKGKKKVEDKGQIFDFQFSIFNLFEELARVPGLRRIRVSSLEPGDISEELLDVFCRHRNIMPHIHLSVQSGSDAILKRMCRQYSADELREKIALIKSRLDRPAITCDIIVGFPGETEEDFQATVELAKWAGFSKMHIFPFSARAGTAAAKMKDRVQPKVVKMRAEVLRKLGDELGFKFREQFVGENCEVLIENEETMSGRCERYFVVKVVPLLHNQRSYFPGTGGGTRKNEIIKVKITEVGKIGATGSPAAGPREQFLGESGAEGEVCT